MLQRTTVLCRIRQLLSDVHSVPLLAWTSTTAATRKLALSVALWEVAVAATRIMIASQFQRVNLPDNTVVLKVYHCEIGGNWCPDDTPNGCKDSGTCIKAEACWPEVACSKSTGGTCCSVEATDCYEIARGPPRQRRESMSSGVLLQVWWRCMS